MLHNETIGKVLQPALDNLDPASLLLWWCEDVAAEAETELCPQMEDRDDLFTSASHILLCRMIEERRGSNRK